MAKVVCDVDYGRTENENGVEVDCVTCTCTECGHETMSYGSGSASVRRCLALMKEECPEGRSNYYVTEEGDEED